MEIDSTFKAYPFAELKQLGKARFSDYLAAQDIEITWNEQAHSAQAFDSNGDEIATVIAFWFAWNARGGIGRLEITQLLLDHLHPG